MSGSNPPTLTFTPPDGTSDQLAQYAAPFARRFKGEHLPQYDSNKDLYQQLRKYRVQHHEGNSQHFWPLEILKALVTPQSVTGALIKHCKFSRERAARHSERIFQEGKESLFKVFTIFLLIEELNEENWTHVMKCRSEDRLRDSSLPLTLMEYDDGQRLMLRRDGRRASCCFAEWRTHALESFEDYQRRLDAPIFSLSEPDNKINHQSFDKNTILPWCECEEGIHPVKAMSGGYGSVTRVKIHPLCHGFQGVLKSINVAGGFFAIKKLKNSKRNSTIEFRKEVDALERFNGKVHKHMVTLLGTFEQNDYYHMIFPWADSDLENYWEANPNPDLKDIGLIRWLSKQCLGIMEAVSVIHNPTHLGGKFGRHGDIKAENVLWYKSGDRVQGNERGILVLSDLGLAALNSEKSRSMQPGYSVGATPSYRPPECVIEHGQVSRAFDIWTLGCLYLELLCWVIRGNDGKRQFDSERMTTSIYGAKTDIFFDIRRPELSHGDVVVEVKEEVTKKMDELHDAHGNCTAWMHELLDTVELHMLVVDPKGRKASNLLMNDLRSMDDKCQNNKRYCLKAVARPAVERRQTPMLAQLNEGTKKNVPDTFNNLRVLREDQAPVNGLRRLTLDPSTEY